MIFTTFWAVLTKDWGNMTRLRSVGNRQSSGLPNRAAAMYYNDAKPDKIFYQGLALLKLGCMDEANGRFHKLTSYGEKHLFDKIKMDYFAVSLPDLFNMGR